MAGKLLALLLLLVATPTFAASYVGTVSGLDDVSLPIPSVPGTYQMSFALSRPVPFDVTVHIEGHYNFYWVDTGEYLGGDDYFLLYTHEYFTPTTTGSFQWTIQPPYSYVSDNILTTGNYEAVETYFHFYGDPATMVTYYVSITAVPEPAHWALLIGGLGLAGAVLRRRHRGAQLSAMIA